MSDYWWPGVVEYLGCTACSRTVQNIYARKGILALSIAFCLVSVGGVRAELQGSVGELMVFPRSMQFATAEWPLTEPLWTVLHYSTFPFVIILIIIFVFEKKKKKSFRTIPFAVNLHTQKKMMRVVRQECERGQVTICAAEERWASTGLLW